MIIVIDCETYKSGKPILDATGEHFVLGVILQDNGVSHTFLNKEDMWDKILKLKESEKKRGKRLVVYGHNMKYDFFNIANLEDRKIRYFSENPFIASYYDKEEVEMEEPEFVRWESYAKSNGINYKILNRALGIVHLEKDREAIKFLDSMSIFRMSVANLGKMLNFPKLEMPKQHRLGSQKMKELEKYCKRDCEIVMKGILMIKDKLKSDDIRIKNLCTISQISISYVLNALKNDQRSEGILHRNKKGNLTEWVVKTKFPDDVHSTYRGGYVRAWKLGKFDKVSAIDCNSLYPFSAMKMRFPDLRTERKLSEPLKVYNQETLLNKIGLSKVLIKNESDELGLLMIRTRTKGYVPLKEKYIIGAWTHTELKKAVENGYKIIDIEWSIVYDDGVNMLSEIYKELYKKRINAEDKFNYTFYKDIMNRSIGKFGQHKIHYEIFIDNVEEMWRYLDDKHRLLRGISEDSYDILIAKKPDNKERKKYYAPIIPALVTAEARCFMYDNYRKVNKEDLLYTDTDSIVFVGGKEVINRFELGDGLGQFKIEKDYIDDSWLIEKECLIWGTKSKSIGNNIAVSGAFKAGITLDDFKKGAVPIRKMIGLKGGDLKDVGRFTDEVKDLRKQAKEFLEEKEEMDSQMIYIDEKVEDISYFRDVLRGVTNEINKGKVYKEV